VGLSLKMGLSLPSSSPVKGRETLVAPPTVPLSPQSSWGGASLASLREILTKRYLKLSVRGLSIPALKGEVFRPLNPFLIK